MKATIDGAGRIVAPRPPRDALDLEPGQPLEARAAEGCPEIEITAKPMRPQQRGKGMAAAPVAQPPALTVDLVRETLERVRR